MTLLMICQATRTTVDLLYGYYDGQIEFSNNNDITFSLLQQASIQFCRPPKFVVTVSVLTVRLIKTTTATTKTTTSASAITSKTK